MKKRNGNLNYGDYRFFLYITLLKNMFMNPDESFEHR